MVPHQCVIGGTTPWCITSPLSARPGGQWQIRNRSTLDVACLTRRAKPRWPWHLTYHTHPESVHSIADRYETYLWWMDTGSIKPVWCMVDTSHYTQRIYTNNATHWQMHVPVRTQGGPHPVLSPLTHSPIQTRSIIWCDTMISWGAHLRSRDMPHNELLQTLELFV
jgi:hypothetical protein